MVLKIGISGKMGSGKSTLAAHLEETYGFVRVSFAWPIKELESIQAGVYDDRTAEAKLQQIINGLVAANKAGPTSEAKKHKMMDWLGSLFTKYTQMPGKKNRPFLQSLGHGARERFGDTIWVDYALQEAKEHQKVVIDDVRYENEIHILKGAGFSLWRVIVDSNIQTERLEILYGQEALGYVGHQSELGLDDKLHLFDHIICNNDSLDDLHRSIRAILMPSSSPS